jgi:SAM-dependent methyltransferase
MLDSTQRFSNRVENYIKYRPTYPPEVLSQFQAEMALTPESVVADIGSGTGISARLFLANGNPVFGVEPNEPMRLAAEELLRDFPKFVSVNGTSEATTLPSQAVDFIIAAQAFHWFRPEPTRAEFRRILRPGGYVALLWNNRQLGTTRFLRDYESFLHEFATDYQVVRHENVTPKDVATFFATDFQKVAFANSQILDEAGLRGRVFSSSYTPTADSPRYEPMVAELNRLFDRHQQDGRVEIIYDTEVFFARW